MDGLRRYSEDEETAYINRLMKRLSKEDKRKAVAMLKVMFPDGE